MRSIARWTLAAVALLGAAHALPAQAPVSPAPSPAAGAASRPAEVEVETTARVVPKLREGNAHAGELLRAEGDWLILRRVDYPGMQPGNGPAEFAVQASAEVSVTVDYDTATLLDLRPGMTVTVRTPTGGGQGSYDEVNATSKALAATVLRLERNRLIVRDRWAQEPAAEIAVPLSPDVRVISLDEAGGRAPRGRAFGLILHDLEPQTNVRIIPSTGPATKIVLEPTSPTTRTAPVRLRGGGATTVPVTVTRFTPRTGELIRIDGNRLVIRRGMMPGLRPATRPAPATLPALPATGPAAEEQVIDVAAGADIHVDFVPGSLADLKPGMSMMILELPGRQSIMAQSKALGGTVVRVEGDRLIVRARPMGGQVQEIAVTTDPNTRFVNVRLASRGPRDPRNATTQPAPPMMLQDLKPGMSVHVVPETGLARLIAVASPPPASPRSATTRPAD